MYFSVTNGRNQLSIGMNRTTSYFRFIEPVAVVWLESEYGKYMAGMRHQNRKLFKDQLPVIPFEDFTGKEEALKVLLSPLLDMLSDGDYYLGFSLCGELQNNYDDKSAAPNSKNFLLFPESVDLCKAANIIRAVQELVSDDSHSEQRVLLNYTSGQEYDGSYSYFIATIPAEEIDQQRVRFYEEKIRGGQFPFTVVMCANFQEQESEYFVVSGHHRLQAYLNLGLEPSLVFITRQFSEEEKIPFDMERLAELLYPWQAKDIWDNWEDKEKQIPEILKRPESPLYGFIKNGIYREWHFNKVLKYEAFYINDTIHGVEKAWYDNKRLRYERHYDHGKRTGEWKEFYKSGKKSYLQIFNQEGQPHGQQISYFENGQLRMKREITNGMQADGCSYLSFFEDGRTCSELFYLNGVLVRRHSYSDRGNLVKMEELNQESGVWTDYPVPTVYKVYGFRGGSYNTVYTLRIWWLFILICLGIVVFFLK